MKKRIIAIILICVMLFSLYIPVYAKEENIIENSIVELLSMDDTKICYYETIEGDRVFLQYVDGILTQKNTLPHGNAGTIIRETISSTGKVEIDAISSSDYINKNEVAASLATKATSTGVINYRAAIDTGYVYYGLRCTCEQDIKNSTYTIRSYIGSLVDLVTILVSSTNLVASIGTTVIKRICVSAGISIVGGMLTDALSTTVSCKRTDYKWTLVDTSSVGHTKTVYGYKYYVADSEYYTGNTYYEGYVPKDWGVQALAVGFHNEMFTYAYWDVVSWGALS